MTENKNNNDNDDRSHSVWHTQNNLLQLEYVEDDLNVKTKRNEQKIHKYSNIPFFCVLVTFPFYYYNLNWPFCMCACVALWGFICFIANNNNQEIINVNRAHTLCTDKWTTTDKHHILTASLVYLYRILGCWLKWADGILNATQRFVPL